MVTKDSVLERSPNVSAPKPMGQGDALPDFFKNTKPFAGTLQVVDIDETVTKLPDNFAGGRLPTLDELDPDLCTMVENMMRMRPIVLFSNATCSPCTRLNALLKHIGLEEQSVTLPVGSTKTGYLDRATGKTFSGREVLGYLNAKFGVKKVPNLFFKGVRVGGTLESLELIQKDIFWKALKSEGIDGPQNVDLTFANDDDTADLKKMQEELNGMKLFQTYSAVSRAIEK
jgi:glutaredoxin